MGRTQRAATAGRRLDLRALGRRFGAVQALDGVSLTLRSGEVQALMGENGAGKSTLIRLLAGLDTPDTGDLVLDGTPLPAGTPSAMRAAGLRFIHQELHPVPGLSVAENMHLDHPWPARLGLVDWRQLNHAAGAALARLDLARIDPRAPMSALSTGDQMLVRIASCLIGDDHPGGAWLYVMDEPTAALTTAESERLFAVIRTLIAQGAGVLYVSHRMAEVMRLADRITVLRDGRLVSSRPRADTEATHVIADMTGRDLGVLFPARTQPPGDAILLRAEGLAAPGLVRADLALRAGEIVGLAGLAGSGRGAVLRAILGDLPRTGKVTLDGAVLGTVPAQTWAQGVAHVPRERRSQGLMLRRTITENIALPHLSRLSRGGVFLASLRQRMTARTLADRVRLKANSVGQPCGELSGGNQQKVLFARALAGSPRVLLLDEPTRGVDVGARADIYALVRAAADRGVAILIASSDLPELLGLCDRIAVMRDGALAEVLPTPGLTEAALLARFQSATPAQGAA